MKEINGIADLTPDENNANRHTERGTDMLSKSLERYGAGRSILVDQDGNVIAGNATLEAAAEKGLGIKVVQTDGHDLVVVQRTDLSIDSATGRGLAIADNRVSQVNLDLDISALQYAAEMGVDLGAWFTPDETAKLFDADLAVNATGDSDGNAKPAHRCPHCGHKLLKPSAAQTPV